MGMGLHKLCALPSSLALEVKDSRTNFTKIY